MKRVFRIVLVWGLLLVGVVLIGARFYPDAVPEPVGKVIGQRTGISDIRAAQTGPLTDELEGRGLEFGAPVFIRIFKEEAELELWIERSDRFELFRTYPICNYSGELGPKLREGDRQSPEGFYRVGQGALNPNSRFHLSFNLGFPNAYDSARARTGSFLMVHGACVSIGCYAMTDPAIEEIYILAEAALRRGQASFDVHAFPFRMTETRMAQASDHEWYGFWQELRLGYLAFEADRQVPGIVSDQDGYRIVSK